MKKITVYLIVTFCFVQNVVFAQVHGVENGHEWVDLGLPSGTKWATCNVGAKRPEQRGHYFAWGEVKPKSDYDAGTYKYGNGCRRYNYKITRYNTVNNYGKNGFVDRKTVLELEDDAAYMNWGGKWRMPTYEQQMELVNQCYWVWTDSYNGSNVNGYIVYRAKAKVDKGMKIPEGIPPLSDYALSDAHIFLPAADMMGADSARAVLCSEGYYWSASLTVDHPYIALCIKFDCVGFMRYSYYMRDDKKYYGSESRVLGLPVRAVILGNK